MPNGNNNSKSELLNVALIVAIAMLIALVVYGTRFHNKSAANSTQNVPTPLVQKSKTSPRFALKNTIPQPVPSFKSPLTDATHPPEDPSKMPKGSLGNSKEFKRILKKQSQTLREEAAAESMRPEEKRSLTLSEKEIKQLEDSGRMIY